MFSLICREAKRRATQFGAILSNFQYEISVLDLFREEKDVCVLLRISTKMLKFLPIALLPIALFGCILPWLDAFGLAWMHTASAGCIRLPNV